MSLLEEPVVARPVPLRRNRDFMLLWGGAAATLLGARITAIAYPLLVLWTTGSARDAGLVGSAALLPQLLVQLPAGALVDRWDRRRLMIFCDLGCVLATASVAAAVFTGHVVLLHLVVVAFTQSSLAIFYQLSERAAVRNLVPAEQRPAALTQNEARSRAAGLLGQPAGSLLFSIFAWVPFLATTVAHLISLGSLLLIRKKFQTARTVQRRSLPTEIGEGLAWLWKERFLRTVIGFIAISNIPFQGLALALMVIVRNQGGSVVIIGIIAGISGLGGMLGALSGMWWMRRLSLRAIVIGGLSAWALVLPAVAFERNPLVLGVLFAASSYVGGLFNLVGGVYMVRITPDHMLGRAGSVATLAASGTNFLGALAGGALLDAVGTRDTVLWFSTVMALLVVLAVASPAVRAMGTTRSGDL